MAKTEVRGGQVKDATITEADLLLADVTTLDVSTTQHGFMPKLPTAIGKFLRDDMTWQSPSAGAGFTFTAVEVNLGSVPKKQGRFNITSSGLVTGKDVLIKQANGGYTGKGTRADEAEMDGLVVSGKVTSATNIECYWHSPTKVWKNFKFVYAISA